jgi:hypothetical protein
MLKTKYITKKIPYTGQELRSLYAYLQHGILGDSVICFRGSCDVSFEHMVDGEDLLREAAIQGSDMLHFLFEIFDRPLLAGVLLQRLFASIVRDVLAEFFSETKKSEVHLRRDGDDIYWGKKKFSISIATRSTSSVLIHFAVNVKNEGTPVPTCALSDFGIDPKEFAVECLERVQKEWGSILEATQKVRSVP